MSHLFGWSYPPGCSGPPDDDGQCEVCMNHVDNCVCEECPECGEVGRPQCYNEHGMQLTEQQKEAIEKNKIIEQKRKEQDEALAKFEMESIKHEEW